MPLSGARWKASTNLKPKEQSRMKVMKWSVIAMAVAAGTSQMAVASSQSESKGFVDDSSLTILNRNLYMNRDFRDNGNIARRETKTVT